MAGRAHLAVKKKLSHIRVEQLNSYCTCRVCRRIRGNLQLFRTNSDLCRAVLDALFLSKQAPLRLRLE